MVDAVRPGGSVLDLQVIRPDPVVESGDRILCEIDGEALFRKADAATAAIDALVFSGRLIEEAVDDHDVRKHYVSGADLIDDFADKERRIPDAALSGLRRVKRPCIVRERCRLRRLRIPGATAPERSSASGEEQLTALAAVAAPAFDTLAYSYGGDDERCAWIGPPPTGERVRKQPAE
jgi:hypothetical protein